MRSVLLLFATLTMALASGCASSELKHRDARMGLLDRLAEMDPARRGDEAVAVGDPEPVSPSSSVSDIGLHWPLRSVQITSPFGQRGREFHEGLDLRAASGTPVYAAHGGQVLYADSRLKGYGHMIVLKHSSGLATIYAHNSKLVVHKGQWVPQGALIAYSGNTGHSTGPHLHFEVREGISAVNPLKLLPKPVVAHRGHMSGAAHLLAVRH